ncbi:MAG: OmpA family protein [Crocinitomicaceae bacterium]|jgi:chemotaxis protein MotB|nr:OmpA family protein [Crocinitomicaceae bacterium]
MKNFIPLVVFLFALEACVPAKKYNELLEKEQNCQDELEKYKASSLDFEGKYKDFEARYNTCKSETAALKLDTSVLGDKLRNLEVTIDRLTGENAALEAKMTNVRKSGEKATASLQADLEAKNLELQRKQLELENLESELESKQRLLAEREARVNELEEAIRRKDEAQQLLKKRVMDALTGFENKGLSVVQKNGKIYVSLEAKLLFGSGSTTVESEGKKALVQLAKVLETEKNLEIIVEGHTDTDKLNSATSPKNNWELSVLRSTSVIEIMLANSKMDPKQLMAAGRGEFLPVDPENKAKNRRIEIIISPNLNELFEIIGK